MDEVGWASTKANRSSCESPLPWLSSCSHVRRAAGQTQAAGVTNEKALHVSLCSPSHALAVEEVVGQWFAIVGQHQIYDFAAALLEKILVAMPLVSRSGAMCWRGVGALLLGLHDDHLSGDLCHRRSARSRPHVHATCASGSV